jgi:hypothetical protein
LSNTIEVIFDLLFLSCSFNFRPLHFNVSQINSSLSSRQTISCNKKPRFPQTIIAFCIENFIVTCKRFPSSILVWVRVYSNFVQKSWRLSLFHKVLNDLCSEPFPSIPRVFSKEANRMV